MLLKRMILFIVGMSIPSMAFAQSIGNVVSYTGRVEIRRGAGVLLPEIGTDIFRKDVVLTGANGRVRILFMDNSVVNIGPGSEIRMQHYESTPSKRDVLLSMLRGKIRFFVSKLTNMFNTYDIHTITAIIGIRGTNFIVAASGKATDLYVVGGVVNFKNILQPQSPGIEVVEGTMSSVRTSGEPSAPVRYTDAQIRQMIQDTTVPFSDNLTTSYNSIAPPPPPPVGNLSRTIPVVQNVLQQPQHQTTTPAAVPGAVPPPPVSVNIGVNYGKVAR